MLYIYYYYYEHQVPLFIQSKQITNELIPAAPAKPIVPQIKPLWPEIPQLEIL